MNKRILGLIVGMFLVSTLMFVSAEKNWAFENYSVNVSHDLNVVGNLTLGQKIVFSFGEIIDNIKDGWIRITGGLEVNGSVNITGTGNALYFPDGTNMTTAASGSGDSIWTNLSNVATYEGDVNITGNLTLSGEVTGQETSRMRATRNTSQSIPNAVDTVFVWNVEDYDNLGEYNTATGRFTSTEAGYYSIRAHTMSATTAWLDNEYWMTSLYVNGVKVAWGQAQRGSAGTYLKFTSLNTDYYLGAGDYIEIKILQNSGASVNTYGSSLYNHFSVTRIHSPITIGGTGADGIWDNVSNVATYDGNVNITGNLSLGGEVTGQEISRVRVRSTEGQSMASDSYDTVHFNVEDYDALNEFDNVTNYKFTAKEVGYYSISSGVRTASVAWTAGDRAQLILYVNDVLQMRLDYDEVDYAVNKYITLGGSDVLYLESGDNVSIKFWNDLAGGVNLDASSNYLSIQRLHSPITIGGGQDGIWDNVSNVATYDGNVNITGNLTLGAGAIRFNDSSSEYIFYNGSEWKALGSGAGNVPVGAVVSFASSTCPDGWVAADGTSGTPDLRGIFVRGAGTSGTLTMANGTAFSATYGEYLNDSFQSHWHSVESDAHSNPRLMSFFGGATGPLGSGSGSFDMLKSFGTAGTIKTDGTYGTPRTGAETRPASYALTYCVKVADDSDTTEGAIGVLGDDVYLLNVSKNFGIGTTAPREKLEVNGTLQLGEGKIRFNDTLDKYEFYNGSVWEEIGTGSGDSLWTNVSNVATYEGDVQVNGNLNITGNLTLNGEVTGQETSRVRVYLGSSQSIPNGWTQINLDAETYDDLGEFSTSTHNFTATEAGYYLIVGSIGIDGTADNRFGVGIYINGVRVSLSYNTISIASSALYTQTTDIQYLESGDVVSLFGGNDDPSPAVVSVNNWATFLNIQRLHSPITIGGGQDGIWDNVSNVATYDGNVNITGNLTLGAGAIRFNDSSSEYIFYNGSEWKALGSGAGNVPVGAVVSFASSTCPDGWVAADGTSGTPDLRGIFVRGAGTSGTLTMANGTAFSATYGEYLNDSFQGHVHSLALDSAPSTTLQMADNSGGNSATLDRGDAAYAGSLRARTIGTDGTNGEPRTGAETRPASYALTYCVKVADDSDTTEGAIGVLGDDVYLLNVSKNFGIGTTSPAYKLDVNGTINAESLLVNGVPVASSTDTYWENNSNDIYYNSGNVGIGTSSPTKKLQIGNITTGISTATPDILSLGNTFSSTKGENLKLEMYNDGNTIFGLGVSSGLMELQAYKIGFFTDGNNERMHIDSNGNVGIGTSSPTEKLHVDNGSVLVESGASGLNALVKLNAEGTSSENNIYFMEDGVDKWSVGTLDSNQNFRVVDRLNGYVPFQIEQGAGDNALYINSSGFVGVGTNSPSAKLHVNDGDVIFDI